MIVVRKIRSDTLYQLSPLDDAELVAEEPVLRISTFGLELRYTPLPKPEWRQFTRPKHVNPVALVGSESSAVYAAFDGDRCIGSAAVTVMPYGWAEILDIRVDGACRRQGVGRMLLDKCNAFAQRNTLHGLRVIFTDQNPGVCHFLTREGFSLCGFDTMACSQMEEHRLKPKSRRPSMLTFYRLNQK